MVKTACARPDFVSPERDVLPTNFYFGTEFVSVSKRANQTVIFCNCCRVGRSLNVPRECENRQ